MKESEPVLSAVEKGFDKTELLKRHSEAFLRQKFPLSEAGEKLKQRILAGENIDIDDFPTVEDPKPELFRELNDAPDSVYLDLSIIRISKGCSRGCLHCALNARGHVEHMPYPAIVKIQEKIKSAWANFREETMRGYEYSKNIFCHYWDNDPFEYVDRDFLHKDGTPADFGDVVALTTDQNKVFIATSGWSRNLDYADVAARKIAKLSPEIVYKIRITVNNFNREIRRGVPDDYSNTMIHIIDILKDSKAPIKVCFADDDIGLRHAYGDERAGDNRPRYWASSRFPKDTNPQYIDVCDKIATHCERLNMSRPKKIDIETTSVSRYSGRATKAGRNINDFETTEWTSGHQIDHDGNVLFKREGVTSSDGTHEKGVEIVSTGISLW